MSRSSRVESPLADQLAKNMMDLKDQVLTVANRRHLTWGDLSDSISNSFGGNADELSGVVFDGHDVFDTLTCVAFGLTHGVPIVPIDSQQPVTRLQKIIGQLGERLLFSRELQYLSHFEKRGSARVLDGAAYCLFTSGSTGIPKGVLISEENLLNTLNWSEKHLVRGGGKESLGLAAPPFFDIGLFEICSSLFFGWQLFKFSDARDPHKVLEEAQKFELTSVFSVPSFFQNLVETGLGPDSLLPETLRTFISGGDFMHVPSAKKMLSGSNISLLNVWGPSETSVVNTSHLVTAQDIEAVESGVHYSLPVGRSTKEMPVRVEGPSGGECNNGEIGEITVAGMAVGMGYLGQVPESGFSEDNGSRVYRSGDLGYFDSEGRLFISGRKFTQIKFRGFRIDPREVEAAADSMNYVSRSCLVLDETGFRPRLTLILECVANTSVTIQQVKSHLRERLPGYMVPSKVVFVHDIPLSPNGKLDRKRATELAANDV